MSRQVNKAIEKELMKAFEKSEGPFFQHAGKNYMCFDSITIHLNPLDLNEAIVTMHHGGEEIWMATSPAKLTQGETLTLHGVHGQMEVSLGDPG